MKKSRVFVELLIRVSVLWVFTFGSVTPEMQNQQRFHGHTQNVEDSISRVQKNSFRVDRLEHQQSFYYN
jgi:hypothetical protein